jgi:hypothetical protein
MLPLTVLRRFDCVLASTKTQVLKEYIKRQDQSDAVRDRNPDFADCWFRGLMNTIATL